MFKATIPPAKKLSVERRMIVDAGPLITLGGIDRLDILLAAGVPIYIPDTVLCEVLLQDDPTIVYQDPCPLLTDGQYSQKAMRVCQFIRDNPEQVHVVATNILEQCRTARPGHLRPHSGEDGICEVLNMMYQGDRHIGRTLVLHEDSDVYGMVKSYSLAEPSVTSVLVRELASTGRLPLDPGERDHQQQQKRILEEIRQQEGRVFYSSNPGREAPATRAYIRA